jgi:hypothetical protein
VVATVLGYKPRVPGFDSRRYQILKRLKPIIAVKHLVPTFQFGFRKNLSTIDQVHCITDSIEESLENKGVCSAVFLDIAQAFDRV